MKCELIWKNGGVSLWLARCVAVVRRTHLVWVKAKFDLIRALLPGDELKEIRNFECLSRQPEIKCWGPNQLSEIPIKQQMYLTIGFQRECSANLRMHKQQSGIRAPRLARPGGDATVRNQSAFRAEMLRILQNIQTWVRRLRLPESKLEKASESKLAELQTNILVGMNNKNIVAYFDGPQPQKM